MEYVVEVILIKKEVIMPRGDRTGPNGNGPMTGRRLGICSGNDKPGFDVPPGRASGRRGRGYGSNEGSGKGMRNGNRGRYGRQTN